MKALSHRQKTKWSPKVTLGKKLNALVEQLSDLRDAQRNLPSLPLDEPIQRGWKRFYVLREDISRRYDARRIRDILREINTTIYSRDGTFKYKDRKGVWKDKSHELRDISLLEWNRKKYPDEWKKYFTLGFRRFPDSTGFSRSYFFNKVWMFVPHTEKHILTHYTSLDGEIESRISEINKFITLNNLWPKWANLNGYPASEWDWDEPRRRKMLADLKKLEKEV